MLGLFLTLDLGYVVRQISDGLGQFLIDAGTFRGMRWIWDSLFDKFPMVWVDFPLMLGLTPDGIKFLLLGWILMMLGLYPDTGFRICDTINFRWFGWISR